MAIGQVPALRDPGRAGTIARAPLHRHGGEGGANAIKGLIVPALTAAPPGVTVLLDAAASDSFGFADYKEVWEKEHL